MIKRFIALILVFAVLLPAAFAAPLFPDVPANHWGRDAVAQLAAKGIIEGYPDGTFKGDRSATRWELAVALARLLAKSEQMWATFASKEDAEELKKLLTEYGEELQALGVRTTELEKGYDAIGKRVNDLEHIRFYGGFDSIYVGQQFGGDLATAGQANAFTVNDWSNGRPLVNGRAVTALYMLGAESNVPNYNLGLELAGFYSYGEPSVDNYWGVTPPYLSNPFTADSGGANFNSMNAPLSKLSLDKFWIRNQKNDAKLMLGSFNPKLINSSVLYGIKNPNINAPYVLPFYGANYNSWFTLGKSNPIYYELMYSKLPSASNAVAPTANFYDTNLSSAALTYNFVLNNIARNDIDGKITFSLMEAVNERVSNGTVQNAGLINIPARSDPAGAGRSQGWQGSAVVGPQQEGVYGAALELLFPNTFKLTADYARSKYAADRTNTNFWMPIEGGLGRIGFEYKPKQWDITANYISVSPTYDPFLSAFPSAQNIPVFLPYSTYYSNYFQLHDDVNYPNNREGIKARVQYTFKDNRTVATLTYGALQQKKASTPLNISMVGFIEPFFPELRTLGSDAKGSLKDAGATLSHRFKNNLNATAGYFQYQISRSALINDEMNLTQKIAMLSLNYPFNRKFTVYGNMVYISYHGRFIDQTGQNFKQAVPSIAASYQLSDNAVIMAAYKYYDFQNFNTLNSNWNGRQTSLEIKMSF
ncbi:MAG: S-layer homology domain-containing protein [Armatimonadota bacterium]